MADCWLGTDPLSLSELLSYNSFLFLVAPSSDCPAFFFRDFFQASARFSRNGRQSAPVRHIQAAFKPASIRFCLSSSFC